MNRLLSSFCAALRGIVFCLVNERNMRIHTVVVAYVLLFFRYFTLTQGEIALLFIAFGLVIGAEMLSRFINWEDRGTCVLFGDGAGAVVVEWREDYPSIHAVLGCHGDPDMLGVTGAEKPAPARIFMHGQPTFKFAVKAVPYCIDQVLEKAGMAIEDVDFFVFHQANARIIDLAAKKYHIPPEKYYKNIQKYGNTSAASIPLVISELHDLGKVGPGSRVLVVGFGGGLTWGGALVEFA